MFTLKVLNFRNKNKNYNYFLKKLEVIFVIGTQQKSLTNIKNHLFQNLEQRSPYLTAATTNQTMNHIFSNFSGLQVNKIA